MRRPFQNTPERVGSAYQDRETAERYDERRFASLRGRAGALLDRSTLQRAIRFAGGSPTRYVDVACGTGRLTRVLAARSGAIVTGADTSDEMLDVARRKDVSGTDYVNADARDLPFSDNQYEIATAFRFFGHLAPEASQLVLSELSRVASQLVIVEVSIQSSLVNTRRRIEQKLKGSYLGFTEEWTWRCFDNAELADELEAAGLVEVGRIAKLRGLSDSHLVCAKPFEA